MSDWIESVNVTEARGNNAPPAPIDQASVFIGTSSTGSVGLSQDYSNSTSLIADYGEGLGVTAAVYAIEQYGLTVRLYKVPSTNPGTYDAIDNSKFTGSAVPTVGATTPLNDYQAYILFPVGTSAVGTAGAYYQTSTDGGRTLSRRYPLGTADSITINLPGGETSGVQVTLQPSSSNLTALYTALNALKTAEAAHFTMTSGSPAIHAASDTTDHNALVAIADATTPATAVTLFNGLLSLLATHVASLTYHTTADAVAVAALAALTPAVTAQDALIQLPALITIYNAHRVLVGSGPVHGSADSTNTAAASTAVPGSINAGDIIQVLCHGPTCASADLDTAGALTGQLCQGTYDFAHLFVAQALSASDAGHVSVILNNLRKVGKVVDAVIYTRGPTVATNETESAWATSIEADFAAFADDRIEVIEGMPTIVIDPITAQIWHRPWAYAYFGRMLFRERSTWVGSPHDGGFADPDSGANLVRLYDDSGVLIGHDEGPSGNITGLGDANGSGNRFTCLMRGQTQPTRQIAYTTFPWVAWASGGRIFTMPQRRIAQAIERNALTVSFTDLGDTEFYDTDPSTQISTLLPEKRAAIHSVIFNALTGVEFEDDISNSADDDPDNGLVQVNPIVTVINGAVTIGVVLAPKVGGLLVQIDLTYAAQ